MIKPCPFCGGKAKLQHRTCAGEKCASYIECPKCGASTKLIPRSVEKSSDEEAIRLWNTRYQETLKARSERPYDAFGDDQGRGDTADDWYRENFVESSAYEKEGRGSP